MNELKVLLLSAIPEVFTEFF